jgi:hypothetical protein
MSEQFAAYNDRLRFLSEHAESQEAASQYRLISKRLRNGESRRYSFRDESLTSRQNAD